MENFPILLAVFFHQIKERGVYNKLLQLTDEQAQKGETKAENKQIDKMDAIGSSAEGQVENSTASSDEPLGETINPMDVSWDES